MEAAATERAREIISSYSGPPIRIMEVCGTHTHEIFRLGIRSLLPENARLISGPGCPVCVTPAGFIDEAVELALAEKAVVCTFGDLVRVPGTELSLAEARARGGQVQIVYSPADAVSYAAENREKEVVFLSVGFETTTPSSCLAVLAAQRQGLSNFSLLTANKTMDNAYRQLKDSADAFLYPGHVCAITGTAICRRLKDEGISGVVTGFTAAELLSAIAVTITELKRKGPFFRNCYTRVVREEGNPTARAVIEKTMAPCSAVWRGLGEIEGSGLALRADYSSFDARKKFTLDPAAGRANPCAAVVMCCAAESLPLNVPFSALAARRSIQQEPVWFQARAPAPPGMNREAA